MADIWSLNGGPYLGFSAEHLEGKPPALRNPLRYVGDRHMVLIAPSRTGKTKRVLLPALYDLTSWSLLVNDIKGELCAMTEAHRRAAGNIIVKLNPFNALGLGSDGFNPIQALDLNNLFPDDALQLAEAVIRVEGKEKHWSQAAQEICAALIMYVRVVIPNGSFTDVRTLLSLDNFSFRRLILASRDTDRRQYELFEKDPDSMPKGYNPPFQYKGKLYPGILAAAHMYGWPQLAAKAGRFADINPENRELLSVLGTALTQTRWLDSIPIAEDLSKNPFDFSIMKTRPVTVYLTLPADRFGSHSSWLRLIITSILQKLMKDVRKPKTPTLLAFDEYAALAGSSGFGADEAADGFPIVARNMPMMAGYGLKLLTVWQDLGQAEAIYGRDGFSSFLGNAGIVQFFAPQDITTAEYIAKRSGQRTIPLPASGMTFSPNPAMPGGMQWSGSENISYIPMPLLLPQDARNFDPGFTIIFSYLEKGPVKSYLPYPTELPHLRSICALDPSA